MNGNERQRRSPLLWVLSIIGGVALFVLLVVVVAYYSGWLSNLLLLTRPPEYSARYYPDDTLLYSWFTLNPGDGQREQMENIWTGFSEHLVFRNWTDDAEDSIRDEYGVDLEDDFLVWIGPEMSFAVRDIDVNREEYEIAMTVDVRDPDAAKEFLTDLLDRQVEEYGADFDRSSTDEFTLWVNDRRGSASYAISDQLLIVASEERFLDAIIERVEGDRDSGLDQDEYFEAAQARMLSRRFSSIYVNGQRASAVLEDSEFGEYLDSSFYDEVPDWLVVSAGWVEDGLLLDVGAPLSGEIAEAISQTRSLSSPASVMPADTVAMLAFSFDPNVDNWREALKEYDFSEFVEDAGGMDDLEDLSAFAEELEFDPSNLNMAHLLDLGLLGFDVFTGIDLEREFFAHLEGEMIVGVSEFDYGAVLDAPEGNAVDAAALLAYKNDREGVLSETAEDFLDWLGSLIHLDLDEIDVGAQGDATVVELVDSPYSPGYVLHDGYLTVATTSWMLERIVRLQNGEGDSLAEDAEYRRALDHLEGEQYAQVYLDLQSLAGLGDIEESTLSKREVRFLRENFSSLAVISTTDGSYERLQLALTFFPDEN